VKAAAAATLAALLAAQATAGLAGRPPAGVAELYRMASAYEVSSDRRICADASLSPRFEAARARLAEARRIMAEAYELRSMDVPPPIVSTGDPCANPGAAATSIANFERAVTQLEAALLRSPRG
jgi:hypothetical protein